MNEKKSEIKKTAQSQLLKIIENGNNSWLPDLENRLPGESIEETLNKEHVSRRSFLKVMGASLALMGMTSCRRPLEEIVPHVKAPEHAVLGRPETYATTMPFGTTAFGLLVTSYEGRPQKIDGNPQHPSTPHGSNAFMQAEMLNLYDPDRSKYTRRKGTKSSFDDFVTEWTTLKEEFDESQGAGLAVLSGSSCSPSMFRMRKDFLKQFPKARWTTYDPVSDENIHNGLKAAFGRDVQADYHFDKAEVILSLDSDFLLMDGDNVKAAAGFAQGRHLADPHDQMNRLYVVESMLSVTGAAADHRLAIPSSRIGAFAAALALELDKHGINIPGIDQLSVYKHQDFDQKWLSAVTEDLLEHEGKCLITVGRRQPAAVHALAAVLNQVLGHAGRTVDYFDMIDAAPPSIQGLKSLVRNMKDGKIKGLVMLGCDPVAQAPVDLDFETSLQMVKTKIHLGYYYDRSARLSTWHIPQTHFLEAWGDACWRDSTRSVMQPLIAPLYGATSEIELVYTLTTANPLPGHDVVRNTWGAILKGANSDRKWREVLHDGLYSDSTLPKLDIATDRESFTKLLKAQPFNTDKITADNPEILFAADHSTFDGRYCNNGWMQELPDPITKLTWDNAVLMNQRTAEKYNLKNGDIARVAFQARTVDIAVWTVPGMADYSLVLPLGYNDPGKGRIAMDAGFDVYRIRTTETIDIGRGAKVEMSGFTYPLSTTQKHPDMEDRPLVREASLSKYRHDPDFAAHEVHVPKLDSLWDDFKYDEGYQWGMTIDLNACIGCGACVVACQSENNIPIVGKRPSGYGREMHWIRIDRYFEQHGDDVEVRFQPVNCQHCEMAPCESVCPVAATSHDEEGLNVMVYNRCVGTRYCANNCPYKVRRFNFYSYTRKLPEILKMVQNPDVTVRSRGVMEKCSYCLQRLSRAKDEAKSKGREVRDGEIQTACQQACPVGAIHFGNLLDKNSDVVKQKHNRNYAILAEFNTRPRTSYQAKVTNKNKKLI